MYNTKKNNKRKSCRYFVIHWKGNEIKAFLGFLLKKKFVHEENVTHNAGKCWGWGGWSFFFCWPNKM